MKKTVLLILLLLLPKPSFAGYFESSYSGLGGIYYGVSETRDNYNLSNEPNRAVFRTDVRGGTDYVFSPRHKIGIHASAALILKEHDKSYQGGEWRFYPWLKDESEYGRFEAGYVFNAAYQLHKGAKDITFFGINDSNLTYFLSNPNWSNGKHSVKFATPKSTTVMNDGRAPKLAYFTPRLGNTVLGFSYAPDNAHRRGMVSRYADYETVEDGYAAGMQNEWQLGETKLYTSLGYGLFNRTDKETSVGIMLVNGRWSFGAGYKKAYIDGHKNPITVNSANPRCPDLFDNYRESSAWNISIGHEWESWKSNVAFLQAEAENTRNSDRLLVFSNVFSLSKQVEAYLVGLYINSHGADKYSSANNRGYALTTGLGLRF